MRECEGLSCLVLERLRDRSGQDERGEENERKGRKQEEEERQKKFNNTEKEMLKVYYIAYFVIH